MRKARILWLSQGPSTTVTTWAMTPSWSNRKRHDRLSSVGNLGWFLWCASWFWGREGARSSRLECSWVVSELELIKVSFRIEREAKLFPRSWYQRMDALLGKEASSTILLKQLAGLCLPRSGRINPAHQSRVGICMSMCSNEYCHQHSEHSLLSSLSLRTRSRVLRSKWANASPAAGGQAKPA